MLPNKSNISCTFDYNFLKYVKTISNFKQVNQFFLISLISNNYNIDIAVFKNIFKVFLNESPIVLFSFYYKPYIGLVVKKTCH